MNRTVCDECSRSSKMAKPGERCRYSPCEGHYRLPSEVEEASRRFFHELRIGRFYFRWNPVEKFRPDGRLAPVAEIGWGAVDPSTP